MTEDPSRDRWGKEYSVNKLPQDVVVPVSNLGDGYVAHPCCILAGATILGGEAFSHGEMVVVQVQEAFPVCILALGSSLKLGGCVHPSKS